MSAYASGRASSFRTSSAMGRPSVRPSKTPERISTRSVSWRGEVSRLWPGRRRSRSRWISAALIGSRGGQPSTTTPTPPPCDSPKVVMRKIVPSELDIGAGKIATHVAALTRATVSTPSLTSRPHPPQQDVGGARAAVLGPRARERQHQIGERRRREPFGHTLAQHGSALRVEAATVDHEQAAEAAASRSLELRTERAARVGRGEPVQIDAVVHVHLAAAEPHEVLAVDAGSQPLRALAQALDLETRLRHVRGAARGPSGPRPRAAARRAPPVRASDARRGRGGTHGRARPRRGTRAGGARGA